MHRNICFETLVRSSKKRCYNFHIFVYSFIPLVPTKDQTFFQTRDIIIEKDGRWTNRRDIWLSTRRTVYPLSYAFLISPRVVPHVQYSSVQFLPVWSDSQSRKWIHCSIVFFFAKLIGNNVVTLTLVFFFRLISVV